MVIQIVFADVLIKYNGNLEIVNDDNELFEYNLTNSIPDNTKIKLTSNVSGSFIYGTRTVTTLFTVELTLLDANAFIDFFLVHLYISKKKGIKNKNS